MSGPTRPPSGGASQQPWTPEQAAAGITCPACGLANEDGARTCRNCGLPIASSGDPLRGVSPGHVDLPKARRSGLSVTVGFVMVIALLLIGGTLAVSGGGILSSGGRLTGAGADPSEEPAGSVDPVSGEVVRPAASGDPDSAATETEDESTADLKTSFDYTCEDSAIKDLSRGKWFLTQVQAGSRDGFDQVYWNLVRQDGRAKQGTVVTMEWTTPKEAQRKYDIPKVQGKRAIVVTFDGPVKITANTSIDTASLEAEGIDQIKKIQLFSGKDGNVRAVIGINSESCAAMDSRNWGKKSKRAKGLVNLNLERF